MKFFGEGIVLRFTHLGVFVVLREDKMCETIIALKPHWHITRTNFVVQGKLAAVQSGFNRSIFYNVLYEY